MEDKAQQGISSRKFSDAIHTVSSDSDLRALIRQRMYYPHTELECMLLWRSDETGKVTNTLPQDEWEKSIKYVLQTYGSKIASTSDRETWPASEDRFYLDGRIRETVEKSKGTGESKTILIQKDLVDRKIYNIPQKPYALCITLKREKVLTEEMLDKGEMSFVRKKRRFSIWWLKVPFRTDFTMVYSATTIDQTSLVKPTFHTELEFVSDPENLALCEMRQEEFALYDTDSPYLSRSELVERELKMNSELLELSLCAIPETWTTGLSLNRYPDLFYRK